ncbi:MAG: SprB repeat-containing protein [Bacteroidetes bacterium]|nr:SprB repeat-containing protein [Bacteroidota bacterium]
MCNGQSTGSATASVTGGTLQYTHTWSNGQMGFHSNGSECRHVYSNC